MQAMPMSKIASENRIISFATRVWTVIYTITTCDYNVICEVSR